MILVLLNQHEMPLEGDVDTESVTVPEKPYWEATFMVELRVVPVNAVKLVGLALIVKSCTV